MAKRITESKLWVYLMAALLPLVLFLLVMLAVFNTQQHNALEALMREAATSASNAVDNQVGATVAVLSALAASTEFQSEDWPAFAKQLRPVVNSAGWLTLAVTNRDSQVFNLNGIGPVIDRVGMEEALHTGRPAVSDLVPIGPNNAEPAVVIRIPVFPEGREPLTLAAVIPSAVFNKVLKEHMPAEWKVALADRNGIILARSHLPETYIGTPLAPLVLAAWQEGRGNVFDAVTKEGIESYGRISPAGTNGWALAIGAPKDSVDGIFRFSRHALWLGGAVAALLTLVLTNTFLRVVERGREAARKRAEMDAEQRLHFALECSGAGMWDWDVTNGRVLWSKECYSLYGVPADTSPSFEAWVKSIHPDDRACAVEYIEQILDQGAEDFRLEYRICHPTRGLRWLLGVGRISLLPNMKPERISGISIDITERKAMEATVQQALSEAERANMAKSRFLAAASHDIRQPIQSLMLFAHALSAKLQGEATAPIVEKVSAALNSLKLLLDSILDISKLDAGLITPDRSNFSLREFLERLAAEYQPRMAAKGLSFRVVSAAGFVESDPALLGRIVGNMLENALKYTSRGGVLLGCRRCGANLAITVCDTGVGIAPEYQEHIFQEFVQVGSHGRDRAQGMGLGLATVKRMAALLGHRVGLRSEVGRGSTFLVEVPHVAACEASAFPATVGIAPKRARILVVDDETAILEGMKVLLEANGHVVAVAGSVDDAVDNIIGGFRPDVVVTDYRLPYGRNGAEVIDRVRHASGHIIPCVVLTGDTEIVAASLPATTLMHKPVDPRDLEQIIGRLCRT